MTDDKRTKADYLLNRVMMKRKFRASAAQHFADNQRAGMRGVEVNRARKVKVTLPKLNIKDEGDDYD